MIFTLLLVTFTAQADLSTFKKQIQFVYEDAKLIEVKDTSISEKIRFSDYLGQLADIINMERDAFNKDNADYRNEFLEYINNDRSLSKRNRRLLRRAFNRLLDVSPASFLASEELKKFLAELDERLAISMKKFNPQALARPNSPKYFHKMNSTKDLIIWAINKAESSLSMVPYIGVVISLIEYVDENFQNRRYFHQNKLLYYLENYSAQELGLTAIQIAKIKTSIYESRLAWKDFSELRKMTRAWDTYGTSRYQGQYQAHSAVYSANSSRYSTNALRIGFATQEVVKDGVQIIINLKDKVSRYQSTPSTAFYYANPTRVYRVRTLIRLTKAGLEMISIPGFLKKEATKYLNSLYKNQMVTEGELVGYFQDRDLKEYEDIVLKNF